MADFQGRPAHFRVCGARNYFGDGASRIADYQQYLPVKYHSAFRANAPHSGGFASRTLRLGNRRSWRLSSAATDAGNVSEATDGRLRPFSALAGGRPGIYAGSLSVAAQFIVIGLSVCQSGLPGSFLREEAASSSLLRSSRCETWETRSRGRPVNGPDRIERNRVRILSAVQPGINAGPITNNERKRPCSCPGTNPHSVRRRRTDRFSGPVRVRRVPPPAGLAERGQAGPRAHPRRASRHRLGARRPQGRASRLSMKRSTLHWKMKTLDISRPQ